ncbi:MAG: hypothetical protein GY870_09880 [archaeon]|nr:hypothetical protein [archaeon]
MVNLIISEEFRWIAFLLITLAVIVNWVLTILTLIKRNSRIGTQLAMLTMSFALSMTSSYLWFFPVLNFIPSENLALIFMFIQGILFVNYTLSIFYRWSKSKQNKVVGVYLLIGLVPFLGLALSRNIEGIYQIFVIIFPSYMYIPIIFFLINSYRLWKYQKNNIYEASKLFSIFISSIFVLIGGILMMLDGILRGTGENKTWFFPIGWCCSIFACYFIYRGYFHLGTPSDDVIER